MLDVLTLLLTSLSTLTNHCHEHVEHTLSRTCYNCRFEKYIKGYERQCFPFGRVKCFLSWTFHDVQKK
jgi:hypothetical protein